MALNEDIGFVRSGQPVKLKFAAYPFQKYGMGAGHVEHVSADAQSEEEARDKGLITGGQRSLRLQGTGDAGLQRARNGWHQLSAERGHAIDGGDPAGQSHRG